MLTDDQLKAMEPSAPLLVAEVRALMEVNRALELQLHDDQTLREDYEALVVSEHEALSAVTHYRAAAHRDEETIRELKAAIKEPTAKSETFREVKQERDDALKKVQLLKGALTNAIRALRTFDNRNDVANELEKVTKDG